MLRYTFTEVFLMDNLAEENKVYLRSPIYTVLMLMSYEANWVSSLLSNLTFSNLTLSKKANKSISLMKDRAFTCIGLFLK